MVAELTSSEVEAQAREKNRPEARRESEGGANAGPHGQAQSQCHVDFEIKPLSNDKTKQEETGLREKRKKLAILFSDH